MKDSDTITVAGYGDKVKMPDEGESLVVTALGGVGKLLYYYVVLPKKLKVKQTLEELTLILEAKGFARQAKIERLEDEVSYCKLLMLIHVDVAVDEVVLPLIDVLNEGKVVFYRHYLVTNTEDPGEDVIGDYLSEFD